MIYSLEIPVLAFAQLQISEAWLTDDFHLDNTPRQFTAHIFTTVSKGLLGSYDYRKHKQHDQ